MSNETIDSDDRDRGGLTGKDREYLRKTPDEREEEYSRQVRSITKKRIRQRARDSLRDFRLLADHLTDEEREKIFAGIDDPRSDEYRELRGDVQAVIEFLYTGMGGVSGFRQPLKFGVANGELVLGNVATATDVAPQFVVDKVYQADTREVVDFVEAEEWDRLMPPDLSAFISVAQAADAIDFEAIRRWLDKSEWSSQFIGKSRRAYAGGKQTPLMDPEIYEREGIADMSGEELQDMFGEGYPAGALVIYDGEKVYAPSPAGSDDDPEILDWIHGEPDDETEN